MYCPRCQSDKSTVERSEPKELNIQEGEVAIIRKRERKCSQCGKTYITEERITQVEIYDGTTQHKKLISVAAYEKRRGTVRWD